MTDFQSVGRRFESYQVCCIVEARRGVAATARRYLILPRIKDLQ